MRKEPINKKTAFNLASRSLKDELRKIMFLKRNGLPIPLPLLEQSLDHIQILRDNIGWFEAWIVTSGNVSIADMLTQKERESRS